MALNEKLEEILKIKDSIEAFEQLITVVSKMQDKIEELEAKIADLEEENSIINEELDMLSTDMQLEKYDSILVVSHFKGHPMGGYGGALKNISIGLASSYGKAYIHGAGEPEKIWTADHDLFLESMADAAKSVIDYFDNNIVYINIMKNMSVDCDCCAKAEDPCMKDIGILSSTDPVALDQACIDLVYNSSDEGKSHLIERIESRNGIHTIEAASELNIGSRDYELINID
jgi:uncharacterized Fe-S center protein